MKYKKINLVNQRTGQYRTAPIGFSWTTFFFGIFPALFRGDWKWTGIGFLLNIITFGFGTVFIMSFIYNKLSLKDLIKNGYTPTTEEEAEFIINKGIVSREELEFVGLK